MPKIKIMEERVQCNENANEKIKKSWEFFYNYEELSKSGKIYFGMTTIRKSLPERRL